LPIFAAVPTLTLEGYESAASDSNKKDQEITVFISYARQDSDAALRLYEDLRTRTELKPWLDKKDLLPGQNWDIEIRKAIKNSRYFIALFSSTSVQKRGYVQKEFKRALDVLEEFPEGEIFAIPVRLDDCKIPYEKWRHIEYVDLFPDWNEGIQRLLRTFEIH
jgi:TIR domain